MSLCFFGLVFGGIQTGLLLLLEFIIYRLYLGGEGTWVAVLIIAFTFTFSLFFSQHLQNDIAEIADYRTSCLPHRCYSRPKLNRNLAPNKKKLPTDRGMEREQQKARLKVSPGGSIVKPLDFNINHNAIKSSYAPNKGRAGMMLRIGFIRVKSPTKTITWGCWDRAAIRID